MHSYKVGGTFTRFLDQQWGIDSHTRKLLQTTSHSAAAWSRCIYTLVAACCMILWQIRLRVYLRVYVMVAANTNAMLQSHFQQALQSESIIEIVSKSINNSSRFFMASI